MKNIKSVCSGGLENALFHNGTRIKWNALTTGIEHKSVRVDTKVRLRAAKEHHMVCQMRLN